MMNEIPNKKLLDEIVREINAATARLKAEWIDTLPEGRCPLSPELMYEYRLVEHMAAAAGQAHTVSSRLLALQTPASPAEQVESLVRRTFEKGGS